MIRVVLIITALTSSYASAQNSASNESLFTVEATSPFPEGYTTQPVNNTESSPLPTSYDVWAYIGFVTVPLLFVVGIVGNIFTVIIMRDEEFKKNVTSYILIALALSDLIVNFMYPFNKQFVRTLIGRDIRALSTFGCHFFFSLWRTVKMSTSWLVVLISVERFIAVVYPFKAVKWIVKSRVLLAISTIYVILGIYNSYWSSVTDRIVGPYCLPNTRPAEALQLSYILILLGNVVYSPIPCVILFITTSIIVHALRRSHAKRKHLTSEQAQQQDNTSRITGMLLGVCIAFLILVTPITIGHLLSIFAGINILFSTDPSVTIYRELAQLMEQTNHSINFFLYVVSSSEFRRVLWDLLRGRRDKDTMRRNRTLRYTYSNSSAGSNPNGNQPISTISKNVRNGEQWINNWYAVYPV